MPYEQVWSHLLEKKILAKYDSVEVLHWGRCGWSTLDEINFFKQLLTLYRIPLESLTVPPPIPVPLAAERVPSPSDAPASPDAIGIEIEAESAVRKAPLKERSSNTNLSDPSPASAVLLKYKGTISELRETENEEPSSSANPGSSSGSVP